MFAVCSNSATGVAGAHPTGCEGGSRAANPKLESGWLLQVFVVVSFLPKTGTHFSARCSRRGAGACRGGYQMPGFGSIPAETGLEGSHMVSKGLALVMAGLAAASVAPGAAETIAPVAPERDA